MTPERVDLPVTIRGLIEGIDADIKMAESGQIGRPEMLDGIFGKATALIKQGVLTDPKLIAIPALIKNVGLHPWVWRGYGYPNLFKKKRMI